MKGKTSNFGARPLGLSLGDFGSAPGEGRHWQDFGTGKATAGMQKLADRFVVVLFNMLGSTKHDAEFGTELIPGIAIGSSMNFGVVQSNVAAAVSDAVSQIISDDADSAYTDSQEPDETLESAVCESVEYETGTGVLRLYVTLTSAAGEEYTYVLPANLEFPA